MHVDKAVRTPQFALLWAVLCLNVTAGIGVLGQASPTMVDDCSVLCAAPAATMSRNTVADFPSVDAILTSTPFFHDKRFTNFE